MPPPAAAPLRGVAASTRGVALGVLALALAEALAEALLLLESGALLGRRPGLLGHAWRAAAAAAGLGAGDGDLLGAVRGIALAAVGAVVGGLATAAAAVAAAAAVVAAAAATERKGAAAAAVATRGTPSSRATRSLVLMPVVARMGATISRHVSTW